jgi:hypothetical protein
MRPTTLVAAVLLLLVSACITSPPLNLSPSPYTTVVRISLVTDRRAAGTSLTYSNDAYVVFRDKSKDKIFSFPIRENQIRAQLGVGAYQVLGLEFEGGTLGYSPSSRYEHHTEHHEARIELIVTKDDLGKEVDFGTYNPVTKNIAGDRLRLME